MKPKGLNISARLTFRQRGSTYSLEYERAAQGMLLPLPASKAYGQHCSVMPSLKNDDFADCIAIPGFVNAHAHLELTNLEGRIAPRPIHFAAWARDLRKHVSSWSDMDRLASWRRGVALSVQAGTVKVLDHASLLNSAALFGETGLGGGVAPEFAGIVPERVRSEMARLERLLDQSCDSVVALAPHAPFSVSPQLYDACARVAKDMGLSLSLHQAESREELEFVRSGTGPIQDLLSSLGWDLAAYCPTGRTSTETLECIGALSSKAIAVHCNYVTDSDLKILSRRRVRVVHCPFSCRFFGYPDFNFERFWRAGVHVCLGSDSLASGESLSLLDAMRLICATHNINAEKVFRMATIEGYFALGGRRVAEPFRDDYCLLRLGNGTTVPKRKEELLERIKLGEGTPVLTVANGRPLSR